MSDNTDFSNPMVVRRVEVPGGSKVEPPLDQTWPDAVKLAWHAAVVEIDSGLPVRVSPANYSIDDVPQHGFYNVRVGTSRGASTHGPLSYKDAWSYMNGVRTGAWAIVKRNAMGVPTREGRSCEAAVARMLAAGVIDQAAAEEILATDVVQAATPQTERHP
jgi:hypothetical protein